MTIAGLSHGSRPIDGPSIKPRWCSSLQPAIGETELANLRAERSCGLPIQPATRPPILAAEHDRAKEGARRENYRTRFN